MASKLDVAVIVTLAAGCALWIEQGHRVVIDAPTQSELAAAAAAAEAAAACPRNDDVPYSANCLAFLFGPNWQTNVAAAAPPPQAQQVLRRAASISARSSNRCWLVVSVVAC